MLTPHRLALSLFGLAALACARSSAPETAAAPPVTEAPPVATPSDPEADPTPAPPAPSPPADADAAPLTPDGYAALEARVTRELTAYLRDEYDQGIGRPTVTRLGHVDAARGTFALFSFRAEVSDGMQIGDTTWMVVAAPAGGAHQLTYTKVGAEMSEPGAESTFRWDSFEGLSFSSGVLRATVHATTGYAEFDTCGSCSARREAALVQTRKELFCVWGRELEEWTCALLELGLRVERASRAIDEDGGESPETHLGPDPAPYEITAEVADGARVTLTLASGAPPEDVRELVGARDAMELIESSPPRRQLSLVDDELLE